MMRQIDLELISGARVHLTLPPNDWQTSCYVFSMEHSGHTEFWRLVTQLLQAAARSPCAVHASLESQGAVLGQVERASLRDLLCQEGYAFGVLFDPDPAFDLIASDSPKLFFLRDPRDVLIAMHRSASAAPSLEHFLEWPLVERLIHRYQRFVEHWRSQPDVTLLRYEHADRDWHAIAAEVTAALRLSIEPQTIASIAASTPALGDQLSPHESIGRKALAALEQRLTGVLAPLGYAPRESRPRVGGRPAATVQPTTPAQPTATAQPPATAQPTAPAHSATAAQPPGPAQAGTPAAIARNTNLGKLFEPDPQTLGRLRPNATAEMHILGRRVIMDVDPTGCRPVVGQPVKADKMFWVYGCSVTYGIAVPAEETFCSLMQRRFPTLRIENHGVPGSSACRNLLHLERDVGLGNPELVTFCWIADHFKRNVAAFDWIEMWSKNAPPTTRGVPPQRRLPRAALDADGALHFRSVQIPRHDLVGLDLSEFAADAYYLDLVGLRLFERANALVTGWGGHFFVTTLQANLSATLRAWLAERAIPVLDASVNGKEYTCWPDDWHPNTLAHRFFAERIGDYVADHLNRTSSSLVA